MDEQHERAVLESGRLEQNVPGAHRALELSLPAQMSSRNTAHPVGHALALPLHRLEKTETRRSPTDSPPDPLARGAAAPAPTRGTPRGGAPEAAGAVLPNRTPSRSRWCARVVMVEVHQLRHGALGGALHYRLGSTPSQRLGASTHAKMETRPEWRARSRRASMAAARDRMSAVDSSGRNVRRSSRRPCPEQRVQRARTNRKGPRPTRARRAPGAAASTAPRVPGPQQPPCEDMLRTCSLARLRNTRSDILLGQVDAIPEPSRASSWMSSGERSACASVRSSRVQTPRPGTRGRARAPGRSGLHPVSRQRVPYGLLPTQAAHCARGEFGSPRMSRSRRAVLFRKQKMSVFSPASQALMALSTTSTLGCCGSCAVPSHHAHQQIEVGPQE